MEMKPDERDVRLKKIYAIDVNNVKRSTNEEVAKMLSVVSAMIGCEIPPTAVLAKYIEMLSEFPADLIEIAGNEVLRKHKWNNFPKLAEFIEPVEELLKARQLVLRSTKQAMKIYGVEP